MRNSANGRLVLTRGWGESIRIGENIKVSVMEIISGKARIVIEAPKSIAVHREEIYDRIQKEKDEQRLRREDAHTRTTRS